MIRARRVVATRLGRPVTNEDRAGIDDERDELVGFVDLHDEVLRRVLVAEVHRLLPCRDLDND